MLILTEEQKQIIGEVMTDAAAEQGKDTDWFDSRNMESIVETIAARLALPDFTPVPFECGNEYLTQSGNVVKIVERQIGRGREAVRGADGMWRYNSLADMGRITGSPHDFSHPENLIPLYRKT